MSHSPVNVLEVLTKASKEHPELQTAYDDLSETSHPNFDGLLRLYSAPSKHDFVTTFQNQSENIYRLQQNQLVTLLLIIFETEYNDRWVNAFTRFEEWIERNDIKLETTKNEKPCSEVES